MVTCPHCDIHNSIDSQFCKACGTALPQDAVAEARTEHEALVAEGYKALNEARTDEALLIATNALEQFPESVSALSLKGMALERQGTIGEALETYEKVVALNPGSALDKIKVQQLRNSMSAKLLHAEPVGVNRRMAAFAAIAAIVFVGAIGVIAANYAKPNPTTVAQNTATTPDLSQANGRSTSNPNLGANDSGSPQGTNTPAGTGNRNNDPNYVDRESKPNPTNRNPGIVLPNPNGTAMPGVGQGGFEPFNPGNISTQPEGTRTAPNTNPNPTTTNKNEDDVDPVTPGGKKPDPTKPEDNPGEIEIKTSRSPNGGSRNGGVDVGDAQMGAQALRAAAGTQFQLGKYDQAARSYERLLGMGGDPGWTNQRIGLCYQNLGQNGQAADAYRKAISTLEARVRSGGDSPSTQAMLRTCRAALKVVGG